MGSAQRAFVASLSLMVIVIVFQYSNLHTFFVSLHRGASVDNESLAVSLPMRTQFLGESQIELMESVERNDHSQQAESISTNANQRGKQIQYSLLESFSTKSLETQSGQLLIVGLADKLATDELKEFLFTIRPGGFVLFRRNQSSPQELYKFIRFLRQSSLEYSGVEPLIAVDEEGGAVTRLPWKRKLPSAHMLAQLDKPELTKAYGLEVGKVLLEFGINVNFAPVLDLSAPEQFLKTRSYGNDEKKVTQHGLAYAAGLAEAGIIPVAKHFPGLSPTTKDPHHDKTQRVFHGPKEFLTDIAPFFKFSKKFKRAGVMLSHSIYPQFNAEKSAVMSPELVSYLKKDLKFQGIVISDDLQMQGISYPKERNIGRIETIVKSSFEAGCDLLMLSFSKRDQLAAHRQLMNMLINPKNKKNLQDKLVRILNIKRDLLQEQGLTRKIASAAQIYERNDSVESKDEETMHIGETKIENGQMTSSGLEELYLKMQKLRSGYISR